MLEGGVKRKTESREAPRCVYKKPSEIRTKIGEMKLKRIPRNEKGNRQKVQIHEWQHRCGCVEPPVHWRRKKNPCRARLKFGPGSHVSTPVTTRGYNARTGANTLASVVN